MNGTEDVIDRHYTVANTMGSDPVSKFILGTTSDEDLTNASTITANNFNDALPSEVTMVRTINPAELELNIYGNMLATVLSDKEDDVKYVGDNTYSIKGSVLREYVDDGYIDYDASGVIDSVYYDVGYEYFKLSPEFDTPEAIENTKNFIINRFAAYANSKKSSAGYDFWPFDDSLEQISKRFKVTGDDAKAVQNSFKDVTVSYDAETGCIKLADLSFADSTAISANHATNFPVIGVLGNLIQMIENKVIYRYNAYFSTGYQRAAGLIRARRVSADNISTLATTNDAGRTNDVKTGIATNEATIVDTVHYEGLTPEVSYTVVGALYDVETGKAIKADGSISTADDVISFEPSADYVTAAKTFEPEEAKSSVDLTFNYDASKLAGHKIVVCEKIYLTSSKQQVGSHIDKTDANQTVMIEVPSVGTSASANGSRTAKPVKEITITDEIEFSGLIPGKAYTIKTVLYDKTAGKKLADTEMSTPFVPDTSFGVTTVKIKFDSSKFGGKSLVVFEKVYDANSVLVASHEDAEDEKQTVTFEELNPEVKTTATNFEKNGKVIELAPTACIYDKVELTGFAGNTTYKLVPSVYDATAGEWLDIAIGEDTTETYQSIDVLMDENGARTIYLPIIIESETLEGHTLVVGETVLDDEDNVVAEHKDIADEKQTVKVDQTVEVKTVATVNGEKTVDAVDNVTIVDTVSYKHLSKTEYTLTAKLYDATANEFIKDGNEDYERSVTFTPTTADGTQSVILDGIDLSERAGHKIVVFETLTKGTEFVADHSDKNDADQTVTVNEEELVPEISTVATTKDGKKVIKGSYEEETTAVVVDKVHYKNLEVGKEYALVTSLFGKKTTADGRTAEGEVFIENGYSRHLHVYEFTADKTEGDIEIELEVLVGGENGVPNDLEITVIEKLYLQSDDHNPIVVHEDYSGAQTVKVELESKPGTPEIATYATSDGESKLVEYSDKADITDKVTYSGLVKGHDYMLKANIYDKTAGKMLFEEPILAAFTANDSCEVVVNFEVDTLAIAGHTLVVFEELYDEDDMNGEPIATHTEEDDENQTVTVIIPDVKTVATDNTTKTHTGIAGTQSVIVDEVTCSGLVKGRNYKVIASVYNKTAEEMVLVDDVPLTVEVPFTAESNKMTVPVAINIDTSDLGDVEFVVFEDLYFEVDGNYRLIASHSDVNDADQTVKYVGVEIDTVATNANDGTKTVDAAKDTVLKDKISYKHLTEGETYTIATSVYDKTAGGKLIAATETVFTVTDTEGSTEVTVRVDTRGLEGHELVLGEVFSINGVVVGSHVDMDDADQTVKVKDKTTPPPKYPSLKTTATSKATGTHTMEQSDKAVIVDRVEYTNLKVGEKYTLVAQAYDKDSSKTIVGANNTLEFVPTSADGFVEIEVPVNTKTMVGKPIVMFEYLYYKGSAVATHIDKDDVDQTVVVMSVDTSATDASKKTRTVTEGKTTVVIDTVTYENLTAGQEYTIIGKLVDKADPTKVVAEATVKFTPEADKNSKYGLASGSVEVKFTFDSTGYAKHTLVCLEAIAQEVDGEVTVEPEKVKSFIEYTEDADVKEVYDFIKSFGIDSESIVTACNEGGMTFSVFSSLIGNIDITRDQANKINSLINTNKFDKFASAYEAYLKYAEEQSNLKPETKPGKVLMVIGQHADINDLDQSINVVASSNNTPNTGNPKTGSDMGRTFGFGISAIALAACVICAGIFRKKSDAE